ncbi:trypsin-like peptidase domain-containing protein [Enterobacteriaceae endosymbiont of Macroplea appendiculata]|uniref:trypsin-like peptidase domain-containing protein n=1 Tax=Enterobacteriaceae endosymbiont of Macroplea appendiculata TaxID=2675790 RepID=UPI00144930FC|nr:trypsin-like peptidase domain-containing protein [Enterobacteriaceae endosymbiont of Macroplea appendiculata]QJC30811.1 trypsin-like serine protease [Enterobacteriaceae endosymbiont of Macroplea appendiculata]
MRKIKLLLCIFVIWITNIHTCYATNIQNPVFFRKNIIVAQKKPTLAPIIEKVISAVVSIHVDGSIITKNFTIPEKLQNFIIEQHLCEPNSSYFNSPLCSNIENTVEEKFNAIGSGIIINANKGFIITNSHVIDHANTITVKLNNGMTYLATIIYKDMKSDIAIIKINPNIMLQEIRMANSDTVNVGDYVIAIGNPFGLGNTVTTGIISALERSGVNTNRFEEFIQTDAAINRGNSGGALINLNGELVGMNTAIVASSNGGNVGVGFAIPSNTIKRFIRQINLFGTMQHGFLGISATNLDNNLHDALHIKKNISGIFVQEVWNKKSALKAGDIITHLNNKKINDYMLLRAKVSTYPAGTKIKLGINRQGLFIKNVIVTLQNVEDNIKYNVKQDFLTGVNLTNIISQGGNHKIFGVRINNIQYNSIYKQIGLQKNDIIFEVNNHKIYNIKDMEKIFLKYKKKNIIVLHILRTKHDLFIIINN